MFKNLKFVFLAFVVLSVFCSSCTNGKRTTVDIDKDWKLNMTDNMDFARPDFDDSTWKSVEKSSPLVWGKPGNNYAWVRKTLTIPSVLSGEDIYIGFARGNFAVEVYANGFFVGCRGNFPPDYNMRIEDNVDILIPKNCIENNTVTLALRIYSMETDLDGMALTLDNRSQAYFQNVIHNIFNQRLFLILTSICVFILVYSLGQYYITKDKAYLIFAVSLLFIIIYFYDMGCEVVLINYPLHRVISRLSLVWSMCFLSLFLALFFKRNYAKKLAIGMIVLGVIASIAYLLNIGKNSVINNLFTIFLIPIFGMIIYGYVIIIRSAKKNMFGAKLLIVGYIGGSAFAFNDIVSQVSGIKPFMWTQGIAFFAIDVVVFIALIQRDGKNQKQLEVLAKTTADQKDRLSDVFQNAKNVAGETSEISRSLTDSVSAVNNAVDSTRNKVNEIKSALDIQGKSQKETASAVETLTQFMNSMGMQIEEQNQLIQSTARGIGDVIQGILSVGDGVSSAADFSNGLSGITSTSSSDMKKLVGEMEKVRDSSKEILGVVTTLDTFAQQTNLLAMNASIEAAHAGETGKGFAVIAREIKDLASQTSQWSARIGEIVEGVIGQIQNSVDLCTKVNKSLSQINVDSQESAKKVGAAAQSVLDQQQAGETIARESEDLARLAKKMQDALKEQSKFTENVRRNMEALFNASNAVDNATMEIFKEAKFLAEESSNLTTLANRTNESSETLTTIMSEKETK